MIQLQMLNRILSTKDSSLITENNLSADYFSDYTQEYNYIYNHITNYNAVPDLTTFVNRFPDFQIIKVEESTKYLLDELYKDKNTRDLVFTFNKIRDCINTGNTEKAMQIFRESNESISGNKNIKPISILKDFTRYNEYIDRTKDFTKYFVKTGFAEIDNLIGGWDRLEDLVTIVGRPNTGKSQLLMKFALSAAEQGLNVGFYEGEMTATKVGYRIDTFLSHISNSALIHGNDRVKLDYKKYTEEAPQKVKGDIKVLTADMLGSFAKVSDLRAFIEREKLDILFVDQHSLLDDDRKGKSAMEKAANISRDLKNLQVLKHIPIISVSQQNRTSTEDGNQSLTQVAQTDKIGQDSTCVIFIDIKDNIMKLNFVKVRDGAKGAILSYVVNFDTGDFRYIPEEGNFELSNAQQEYENRYDMSDGEDIY